MEPTVRVGGHFVVDKVGFHLTGVHRADVVEFPIPHGSVDRMTIKRVLGLGGDAGPEPGCQQLPDLARNSGSPVEAGLDLGRRRHGPKDVM